MTALQCIDETPERIQHLVGLLSHEIGRPLHAEQLNHSKFRWLIADEWMNEGDEIILMIMIHADDGDPDEWRYTSTSVGNGMAFSGHGNLRQLLHDLSCV